MYFSDFREKTINNQRLIDLDQYIGITDTDKIVEILITLNLDTGFTEITQIRFVSEEDFHTAVIRSRRTQTNSPDSTNEPEIPPGLQGILDGLSNES